MTTPPRNTNDTDTDTGTGTGRTATRREVLRAAGATAAAAVAAGPVAASEIDESRFDDPRGDAGDEFYTDDDLPDHDAETAFWVLNGDGRVLVISPRTRTVIGEVQTDADAHDMGPHRDRADAAPGYGIEVWRDMYDPSVTRATITTPDTIRHVTATPSDDDPDGDGIPTINLTEQWSGDIDDLADHGDTIPANRPDGGVAASDRIVEVIPSVESDPVVNISEPGRHLIARLDRDTGNILWSTGNLWTLPYDEYDGGEHPLESHVEQHITASPDRMVAVSTGSHHFEFSPKTWTATPGEPTLDGYEVEVTATTDHIEHAGRDRIAVGPGGGTLPRSIFEGGGPAGLDIEVRIRHGDDWSGTIRALRATVNGTSWELTADTSTSQLTFEKVTSRPHTYESGDADDIVYRGHVALEMLQPDADIREGDTVTIDNIEYAYTLEDETTGTAETTDDHIGPELEALMPSLYGGGGDVVMLDAYSGAITGSYLFNSRMSFESVAPRGADMESPYTDIAVVEANESSLTTTYIIAVIHHRRLHIGGTWSKLGDTEYLSAVPIADDVDVTTDEVHAIQNRDPGTRPANAIDPYHRVTRSAADLGRVDDRAQNVAWNEQEYPYYDEYDDPPIGDHLIQTVGEHWKENGESEYIASTYALREHRRAADEASEWTLTLTRDINSGIVPGATSADSATSAPYIPDPVWEAGDMATAGRPTVAYGVADRLMLARFGGGWGNAATTEYDRAYTPYYLDSLTVTPDLGETGGTLDVIDIATGTAPGTTAAPPGGGTVPVDHEPGWLNEYSVTHIAAAALGIAAIPKIAGALADRLDPDK